MINFVDAIISGDIAEILGDLYAPTVAAVAASWAVIAFGVVADMLGRLFTGIINWGGKK